MGTASMCQCIVDSGDDIVSLGDELEYQRDEQHGKVVGLPLSTGEKVVEAGVARVPSWDELDDPGDTVTS